MAFLPRQRSQIYSEVTTYLVASGPFTSTTLGKGIATTAFAFSDQLYELYVEMQNALALLDLNTTTGTELDSELSDYPDLPPRFAQSSATGNVTVTDEAVTVHATAVAGGGATHGNNFVNAVSTAGFPSTGYILVGVHGSSSFESFVYTSISGNTFHSTSAVLTFDHGSAEPVVLGTVGDRTFSGPFTVGTVATKQNPVKLYGSNGSLTILDGAASGLMPVIAKSGGLAGNTPAGSITRFVGTSPFPGALVSLGADINNGVAKEQDPDVRQRIRRGVQSLSSANIDACVSALTNVNYNGQFIKFTQLVEDPSPTIPSIIYVDDGSGFIPSQATSTGVTLINSALGQETHTYIPTAYLPVVTSLVENAAQVFSNVVIYKNGSPFTQGTAPDQCLIQPDRGVIRFNTPLLSGDQITIHTITYFTGLMAAGRLALYGDRANRAQYPGVVGQGQWVQLRAPNTTFVTIIGGSIYDGTVPPATVQATQQQNFLTYVNSLGIAGTLVVRKLASLGFVAGVVDFNLTTPIGNIVAPDGTLLKTTIGNITLA